MAFVGAKYDQSGGGGEREREREREGGTDKRTDGQNKMVEKGLVNKRERGKEGGETYRERGGYRSKTDIRQRWETQREGADTKKNRESKKVSN